MTDQQTESETQTQQPQRGNGSELSGLVMRLRQEDGSSYAAGLMQEAADEIEKMREALKTANQALLEINHAQLNGPGWYTRGESGMFQQVRMWIERGLAATKDYIGA